MVHELKLPEILAGVGIDGDADEENRLLPGRSMPTRSLFGAPSGM
jgi:hypothetical protein